MLETPQELMARVNRYFNYEPDNDNSIVVISTQDEHEVTKALEPYKEQGFSVKTLYQARDGHTVVDFNKKLYDAIDNAEITLLFFPEDTKDSIAQYIQAYLKTIADTRKHGNIFQIKRKDVK
jgi:acetolactate synthase small subunit